MRHALNEGFNRLFKSLMEEDDIRDDIDADADDKKEKAKTAFMKKKDDADSDKDYKLKKANLKEANSTSQKRLFRRAYNWYWNSEDLDGIDENDFDSLFKHMKEKFAGLSDANIEAILNDEFEVLEESDKQATISIEDAQKWVDYDMKRYGKISATTNDLVKKAGFQIIKDDHGDYEVAAGKFESIKEDKKGRISKSKLEKECPESQLKEEYGHYYKNYVSPLDDEGKETDSLAMEEFPGFKGYYKDLEMAKRAAQRFIKYLKVKGFAETSYGYEIKAPARVDIIEMWGDYNEVIDSISV